MHHVLHLQYMRRWLRAIAVLVAAGMAAQDEPSESIESSRVDQGTRDQVQAVRPTR